MPTAHAIHKFTGFSRPAIDQRVSHFGLTGDIKCKDLFDLKPKNAEPREDGEILNLQDERAKEAHQSARLKRLQADEKERILIDSEETTADISELFEGFADIIKKDPDIADDRKEDILGGIQDFLRKWGERFG